MNAELHTLKNGLQVIFVDIKAFPTITTVLLVGAGSRYENKDNNGIAHFFEHMAFKGSKKYPDSFVISSTVEGLGGIFNAFTSKDHTGYWIKSLADHFDTAVDVLSDMIQHSLLVPEEIEREKGVITEEINMYHDMPQRKVGEMFEALLYKDSPLGFEIAGHKEIINKFDKNTFVDYMRKLYHPNNAVLVVAGGLKDKSQYLNQIKSKLENWQEGEKSTFVKINESQTEPQIFIKHKKTEQAHFCIGFRAFSFNDSRKYALNVLSAILGGGMSSRLFIQVRERRGLCYYISTGNELYSDCGNIVTQAGVTNNLDKVKEAIKVILNEHEKITKGEIKDEELKRAKELIKGRFLLSLEDSSVVANYFGTKKLLQDSLETPQEVIKKIEAVTSEEVSSLASNLFVKRNLNLAMVGPFEETSFSDYGNI